MTVATTVWADIDEAQFHAFLEGFFGDLGAVMHAATVLVGDRLGLYRAMDDSDWHTPEQIAEATDTHARYVHEWLAAQAASSFAEYDPATGRFRLTPVQALALTGRHGIFDAPAGLLAAASVIADVDLLCDAFTTGRGLAWGDRHPDLTEATLRFFRGNYATHLVPDWIPALDGVEDQLRQGTRVADIGCGGGASTILMAQAYPASQFIGFDSHGGSIDLAKQAAAEAGVADRCRFETATAKEYTGSGYGLVTVFDALHDMGDPTGAAAHVLDTLTADGTWMIVEPFAHDRLEDNLTPIGRIFYSASTTMCLPMSRSQEVDAALGGQAGETRIREVVTAAGFTRFRRAAETGINLIFEARP
ncbi:MAG: class I SAM-dependent methyltransferase [Actinobacteria bacterium]|nr:class I SAM-dependent methyltransferase [Actinomycetota bacterium]